MDNISFYQDNQEKDFDQIIDFKEFFLKCINNWYIFVLSILFSLSIVIVINKFTKPLYKTEVKILVKNELDPVRNEILKNIGFVSTNSLIENEIGILKSKELLKKTLLDLDYNVIYFKDGILKNEINNQPFKIEIKSTTIPINVKFLIEFIDDSTFILKANSKEVFIVDYYSNEILKVIKNFNFSDTLKYDYSINNEFFNFKIVKKQNKTEKLDNNKKYLFQFNSLIQQMNFYSNFNVQSVSNSSILVVSFKSSNIERSVEFLNKLAENYLMKGIERDEQVAANTIKFIDNQLANFVDSLEYSENMLQQFKVNNKLLNLNYQAQQIWDKIQNIHEEKIKLILRKRYYEYLKDYLKNNEDIKNIVVPSSMNIDDPILNNLLLELINLYSELNELSYNTRKDNPLILSIESKIQELQKKLIENINNNLKNLELAINEKDKQMESFESLVIQMPIKEQQLFRIERKYKLNDALVNFLLTKRSEMQIARAANIPKNEILDKAEIYEAVKVSPNIKLNFILGLIFGLFIPAIIFYFKEYFRDVISNKKEIETILPDVPIIGQLVRIKENLFDIIDKELIATESFNTIKAALQILEENKKIILITSVTANEGKSFVSYNLAKSFASSGKKTILVDFDLRNSNFEKYLKFKYEIGIVSYLVNNNIPVENIINRINDNLDIIPAGPFHLNPGEINLNKKIETLVNSLKNYNYIIIDTPPAGIVSDALILSKYSDINILVVRENYTPKSALIDLYNNLKRLQIKFYVIYNFKEKVKSYYYKYGYYYKNKII